MVQEVDGLISKAELNALRKYAAGAGTIVEIGSYKGKSAIAMASATQGQVYCIDLWQDHPTQARYQTARRAFDRNVKASGFAGRITPIQGLSSDVVKDWEQPIDMLFIDGCHKYDYVRSDFELWSPFVTKWIAFHDHAPNRKYGKDVAEFCKLVDADPEWEFTEQAETLRIYRRVR